MAKPKRVVQTPDRKPSAIAIYDPVYAVRRAAVLAEQMEHAQKRRPQPAQFLKPPPPQPTAQQSAQTRRTTPPEAPSLSFNKPKGAK